MNWESALIRRILAALTAAILFLTGAGPYVAHETPGTASGAVVQAGERPQHGLLTPATAYLAADPAETQKDDDADPDSRRPRGHARPRRRRPWLRRRRRGAQKSSGVG